MSDVKQKKSKKVNERHIAFRIRAIDEIKNKLNMINKE